MKFLLLVSMVAVACKSSSLSSTASSHDVGFQSLPREVQEFILLQVDAMDPTLSAAQKVAPLRLVNKYFSGLMDSFLVNGLSQEVKADHFIAQETNFLKNYIDEVLSDDLLPY